MGIEGLVWLRRKELVEKAKKEDLTSDELLALKSTSFYGPIKLLSLSKGSEEAHKELYVRTNYNILRTLDECEDVPSDNLNIADKKWMISTYSYVIGEVMIRDANGNGKNIRGIEDIINGNDFKSVIKKLIRGLGTADETTRVFVEQFEKGSVLRDLFEIRKEGDIGKDISESIDYCVKNMANGMTNFLENGPIETVKQLHTYCTYVAGKIGCFLNKLVRLKDKDEKGNLILLNDELAERFGKGLQLTNIIKNMRLDYKEGRRFVPGSLIHGEISYENMMDGKSIAAEEARENVLGRLLYYSESNLKASINYVKSIPEKLSGFKAFCLVPLITAKKTLENIKESGAKRVFNGEEDAIKITYGIEAIMEFVYNIVKYDCGKRTNTWLDNFANDSKKFSLKPLEYLKWKSEWIG